ncbi:DNA-binding response regulator [Paraflavitalea soli]|uniref:DNA-binding response regulator n=1 Tax=Paraflavitalea soli TaxID=2315862 RepID=A0A3B7MJJ0_9BACT|nr:LytTR family DNA-binding domain-containing protein [Paraflavitalea soli]AXY73290.1 DNA-binding response regulator [Paraflavitalea soli]
MNILIIEDEDSAATQLTAMVAVHFEQVDFAPVIDNVEDARDFLAARPAIDLIFLDINLSDGLSFSIFKDMVIDTPIIFTTAYDQYAIQAFELNSIDYLLKPIRSEKLTQAIDKFKRLDSRQQMLPDLQSIEKVRMLINAAGTYKRNFLVPYKDKLIPLGVADIAWFELQHTLVRGMTHDKASYFMEEKSLEELGAILDPWEFYRANRQFLVSRKAIKEVQHYFNGRLYVHVLPAPPEKILISKAKAGHFKAWMRSR